MSAASNFCTLLSADDCSPRSREADVSTHHSTSCGGGDDIAGNYQLDAMLGEGAAGQIWNAHDRIAGHSVAVKVVARGDREPEAALSERLLLEGRATASLNHPGIVEVFDFGIVGGREGFVVMELLDGEDLQARIHHDGEMSAAHAVRLLIPILGALGHAHLHGVVHRDVKPANIFLAHGPDGWIQPKLVDFGVAKMAWEPSQATDGMLVGSPAYMSPEQAQSLDAVDCRTDLWSFAVVLYEAIAGQTPWDASNWPALLHAIVSDPATSLVGKRGVDAALWGILQRGLEKDPDARWQTSHEFEGALAGWLASQDAIEDLVEESSRPGSGEGDDQEAAPLDSCVRPVCPRRADEA